MRDLKVWEDKIKDKRKKTDFRDFIKEIASWCPMNYYKNKLNISIFPISDRIKNIYSIEQFNNIHNNLLYKDYNWDFFCNFLDIQKNIPIPCTRQYWTNINSQYTDTNANIENWLFVRCSTNSKNILYSYVIKNTQNVLNSIKIQWWEWNIYSSYSINDSFNIFYSKCIDSSSNIWFSYNIIWCSECILCNNIQNSSFMIKNIQFKKKQYFIEKEKYLKNKLDFENLLYNIWWLNFKNINSKNIENVIWWTHIINWRNAFIVWNPIWTENIFDTIWTWTLWNYYACADCGVNSENVFCSIAIVLSNRIYYSYFLESCSFCLGCIWLKNKSYCILNKQYSKEEWYILADRIFAQMDNDWILWDFFPWSLNPFYFNDTMAYLIDDSFTKEEVEKEGYMWREENIKVDIPEGAEIIYTKPPLTPPYQGGEQIPPP